jgi:hypothetical protein
VQRFLQMLLSNFVVLTVIFLSAAIQLEEGLFLMLVACRLFCHRLSINSEANGGDFMDVT